MKTVTSLGEPIDSAQLQQYFGRLINRFFKILPMKENGESSLTNYIQSLQRELLGCLNLVPELKVCDSYITLLSILEFLNREQDCPIPAVRTEVFHAINICKSLGKHFSDLGVNAK